MVSIIICTYNGAHYLPNTIGHLNRIKVRDKLSWEVILVDNNSTDNSAEVAYNAWTGGNNFRIVKEPIQGLIYARIRGLREARFDYITYIDDDNGIDPDWVNIVHDIFQEHPDVAVCGGDSIPEYESAPPEWFNKYSPCFAIGQQAEQTGDITDSRGFVWGAGICFRKTALESLINRHYPFLLTGRKGSQLSAGEDTELCYALRLQGWRIWYDKRLQITHHICAHRMQWDYLSRMYQGFGSANAILLLYNQIYHHLHPKENFILEPIFNSIKTLWIQKKYIIPSYHQPGCHEWLEIKYYRAYLKQLICLIPSYWKLHHQIRSLAFQNRLKAKPCRWNESIIFDQFLMPYMKKGWITPERWTNPDGSKIIDSAKTFGKTAIIEFPLENIPNSTTFNLDIHILQVYLNPPRWKQQRVSLYINRHKIKSWVFSSPVYRCETVTAPTSILKNSPLISLKFEMPDARSHLKMGISSDKRIMALNLRLIRFWN